MLPRLDPDGPRRGTRRALVWLAKRSSLSLLVFANFVLKLVPERVLPLFLAVSGTALCALYALRLVIHLAGGYVTWRPVRAAHALGLSGRQQRAFIASARRLNFFVACDGVLILTWLFVEMLTWQHRWAWTQLLLASLLWWAVPQLAGCTVIAARRRKLPRGWELVRKMPIFREWRLSQRAAEPVPGHRWLKRFWDEGTTPSRVSKIVVAFGSAFATLAFASTPPALAELAHTASHLSRHAGSQMNQPGLFITVAPTRQPTYTDLCGTSVSPGDGAPPAVAKALRSLWLGGSFIAGAGAVQAGCASPAFPEPGHPESYVALGMCAGKLRSLGLKADGRPPVLLYQEAAEFALRLFKAGKLNSASARVNVGAGDLYLLDTPSGTWALFRDKKASAITRTNGMEACAQQGSVNRSYVAIPPPLVAWWTTAMRNRHEWLVPSGGDTSATLESLYTFTTPRWGEIMAQASCQDNGSRCSVRVHGKWYPLTTGWTTSLDDVLRFAPT